MCDDGVFVGEWIIWVVVYCGFIWIWGDEWFIVVCGNVMFWRCLDWWENGVLKCEFLCLFLLVLLLILCGLLNVILVILVGEDLWEIELFVLFVFVDFLFGVRFISFLGWWLILKCLNGLLSSLGGIFGFFFCFLGFLNKEKKNKILSCILILIWK